MPFADPWCRVRHHSADDGPGIGWRFHPDARCRLRLYGAERGTAGGAAKRTPVPRPAGRGGCRRRAPPPAGAAGQRGAVAAAAAPVYDECGARCRSNSTVRPIPSRRDTPGAQPSSSVARVMSGWRTLGSSIGSASIDDLAGAARDLQHHLGQLRERVLVGVAEVHRLVHAAAGEAEEALDEVVDVAERPRLRAVAEHGERLVLSAPVG